MRKSMRFKIGQEVIVKATGTKRFIKNYSPSLNSYSTTDVPKEKLDPHKFIIVASYKEDELRSTATDILKEIQEKICRE